MSYKSKIEWTDTTWNPVVGCTIVSRGCTNCYAMKMVARLETMGGKTGAKYSGLINRSRIGPIWNNIVRLDEASLNQPLRWKRSRRIFVNSMSDLFHEELSDQDIDRVLAIIALCPQHTFQVLTKRPERMLEYMNKVSLKRLASAIRSPSNLAICTHKARAMISGEPPAAAQMYRCAKPSWPLPNLWLGVSVEDQKRANERVPLLLETPAALRFISCEPLLGPVDMKGSMPFLDWIIAGGESGPKARPMHPFWARGLRDQCAKYGIPFFFKQWGEWLPDYEKTAHPDDLPAWDPAETCPYPTCVWGEWNEKMRWVETNGCWHDIEYIAKDYWSEPEQPMTRYGKKRAGRLLDGRTWDQYPGVDDD